MQFALSLVIVLLTTTAQADLLSRLPIDEGVAIYANESISEAGSDFDSLDGDLPLDNLTATVPDLPIPNVGGLTGLLVKLLAVLQQTLKKLLAGANIPDVANVVNVANAV